MSKKNQTEDTEIRPDDMPPAPDAKGKRKAKDGGLKVVKSKAEEVPPFDFVGKVERLRINGDAGAEAFEFGLRGRHGKRQRFRLDPAGSFAASAMAHLVLAAHGSGAKIGIRSGAEADGVITVKEIESRPRLGK